MKCDPCDGKGFVREPVPVPLPGAKFTCRYCDGTGEIGVWRWIKAHVPMRIYRWYIWITEGERI